ncbi:hypothetical protein V8E36_008128 [Tilletia maclaganii]
MRGTSSSQVSSAVRSAAAAPAVEFENRDEQDKGGTRLDFFADQERDRAQQGQSDRPAWLWLFELVLIWLNVVHFVSEKACVALLEFGEAVAQQYDTTYGNSSSIPTTSMYRMRHSLGLDYKETAYALCPDKRCYKPHVFPAPNGAAMPKVCTKCDTSLFHDSDVDDLRRIKRRPIVKLQYHSVTGWLTELLIESWKTHERVPGVYSDLCDGRTWLLGDEPLAELRISAMIDGISPFGRPGTPAYSCIVLSVRLDNLPAHLRNTPDYTHVVCVIPGKPQANGLHAVLDLFAAEMEQLRLAQFSLPAHVVRTDQRARLPVRLCRLLADSEARTVVAGFPGTGSKSQFCPWCTVDHSEWVSNLSRGIRSPSRNPEAHRSACLSASSGTLNKADLDKLRREQCATMTSLYKITGWSSLSSAPIDIMHALDMGVTKHFWFETIVKGGLLSTAELSLCRDILERMTYPHGVERMPLDFGSASGGSPTSSKWSVAGRYVMPILLASAWRATMISTDIKTFVTSKTTIEALEGETQDVSGTYTKDVNLSTMVSTGPRSDHIIISTAQLQVLHADICTFVDSIATAIHPRWVTYNYHILTHLVEHIQLHGPASAFWAYNQERSYGLMKQINTNQHRNGELEITMQNRTRDRHRLGAMLSSADTASPAGGEESDAVAEGGSSAPIQARPHEHLIAADMAAVCRLLQHKRSGSTLPVIPSFADALFDSQSMAIIVDSRATYSDVGRMHVKARSSRHGLNSDPSACIVSTTDGPRLARFDRSFIHTYFDPERQKVYRQTYTYAIVYMLRPTPWPTDVAMRSRLWSSLGFLSASVDNPERRVIFAADVTAPAITFPGDRIVGNARTIIGVGVVP